MAGQFPEVPSDTDGVFEREAAASEFAIPVAIALLLRPVGVLP